MKWFRTAADRGVAEAQSALGSRYENGQGARRGLGEARKWSAKAVEQGDDFAAERLRDLNKE